MNTKKFSRAMGRIDSKYIDEAIHYNERTGTSKKKNWFKLGAVAACLCLMIIGTFTFPHLVDQGILSPAPAQESGDGFTMEGSDVLYLPISFSQRKMFKLIDERATGLTAENTYEITSEDLGDRMGVVGNSQNENLIGETVYHFIKYPADDSICIVKTDGNYQFYVRNGVDEIQEIISSYRLHIMVSSNAEEDLEKLRAFDTTGKALEIEYSASSSVLELE